MLPITVKVDSHDRPKRSLSLRTARHMTLCHPFLQHSLSPYMVHVDHFAKQRRPRSSLMHWESSPRNSSKMHLCGNYMFFSMFFFFQILGFRSNMDLPKVFKVNAGMTRIASININKFGCNGSG